MSDPVQESRADRFAREYAYGDDSNGGDEDGERFFRTFDEQSIERKDREYPDWRDFEGDED